MKIKMLVLGLLLTLGVQANLQADTTDVPLLMESNLAGARGSAQSFYFTLEGDNHTIKVSGQITAPGNVNLILTDADSTNYSNLPGYYFGQHGELMFPNVSAGEYKAVVLGKTDYSGFSFEIDDVVEGPLPDLITTKFRFKQEINRDLILLKDNLHVGDPFIVKATIKNKGDADATNIPVHLFASEDGEIDPKSDVDLGILETIPRIPAGGKYNIKVSLTLPLNLSHTLYSTILLGIAIDPEGTILEKDKSNNWNVGPASNPFGPGDTRKAELFDPELPREKLRDSFGKKYKFASYSDADAFLKSQGFQGEDQTHFIDSGYSLDVQEPHFSYHNGQLMEAGAFRYQAGIRKAGNKFSIEVQGPEPNPRHYIDQDWYIYTAFYHLLY